MLRYTTPKIYMHIYTRGVRGKEEGRINGVLGGGILSTGPTYYAPNVMTAIVVLRV